MKQHKPPIIELHDVSFSYGHQPILTNINLTIQAGEFVGIIGPNGGGKTTVLKLMLGLLKPKQGTVKLFYTRLDRFKEWSRLGYISQKAAHLENRIPFTVREIVALGRVAKAGLFHLFNQADADAVDAALKTVDLLTKKHDPLANLSGGQLQRVLIAKALASHPDILILDEPTVGVDEASQTRFYELLVKLNKEQGITIVMVSHDVDIIAKYIERFVFVNRTVVQNSHLHGHAHGAHHA